MAESETSTHNKTKLTDRGIQALKPAAKRHTVSDTEERGLGVSVTETGHKSFVVVRRIRDRDPVKYTIKPEYPTMTLALAREKAAEVKRALAAGINPRERERAQDEER